LIQRIHSVERWLLTDVNEHVVPTELVYFRKKGKVYLSIVPMRSIYFEKYFTLINAVTQSCPTDSSITIYEAESGVISASIYEAESSVISALRSTRQNLV